MICPQPSTKPLAEPLIIQINGVYVTRSQWVCFKSCHDANSPQFITMIICCDASDDKSWHHDESWLSMYWQCSVFCFSKYNRFPIPNLWKSEMGSFVAQNMVYALCQSFQNCMQYHSYWTVSLQLYHISGLVKDCSNSSALALELLQSCTKPSTCASKI